MRPNVALLLVVALLLSVFTLVPLVTHAAPSQWIKYSGNPVLGPTPASWDSDYTVSPRVLYDQNAKVYRMWYNGGNRTGVNGIGYATSIDGFVWTKYASRVLTPGPPGSWDSALVQLGSVIWNGTIYLMWYRGTNGVANDVGAIGLATSNDAISFTKFSGNPVMRTTQIDQGYLATPYVIRENITYNMWYTGRNSTYSKSNNILYATSFDGTHWTKWPSVVFSPSTNPKAWDTGSVYSPSVYYNGTTFGLWYSGLNQSYAAPQIGFAISPDGSTWTRYSMNPILSPGPAGTWDSAAVEQTGVVPENGFVLYYDGFTKNTGGSIGLARAPQGFPIPEFPLVAFPSVILGVITCAVICLRRNFRN